ncbi:MAG: hypothetical protein JW912_07830 [Sedimentisphaerales bacterium]|nr:hypothetical protein [Sedimentisphaerales bacterium]
MKSKKKAILLTAAFVLTIFLLQQIYGYVRTGRSCIFTYRGSITPKDFGCIVDDIREQLIIMLHGNKGPLDAKSFCELIDKLELAENQPLKDRGIELIHNKETNTIYLYGTKAISEFLKKTYPTYSDEWHVLLVVNKSLYEKPKGKYHAFMLSRKGNDWLAVTTQIGVQIDSWVPPIPGCLYNVEEKKLYVPPELLPAYKIIYPNLDIPVTSFMELSSVM